MLTIRFQRVGRRNQPFFRMVLIEKHRKAGGMYKEMLGSHDPRKKVTNLKKDRILHWVGKGVTVSPTVHNLLVTQGVLSSAKVRAWHPKKRKAAGAEKPAA